MFHSVETDGENNIAQSVKQVFYEYLGYKELWFIHILLGN